MESSCARSLSRPAHFDIVDHHPYAINGPFTPALMTPTPVAGRLYVEPAGPRVWRTLDSTLVRAHQVLESAVPVRELHGRSRTVGGGQASRVWTG